MLGIVKTINGVKQLVPLTTDSGQGLPLGAITAFYGTTPPNGYLICDGSEFSTTDYPALYTFLGDNHTPDLRGEFLRGAGTNGHTNQGNGGSVGEHQDATVIQSIVSYDSAGNMAIDTVDSTRNIPNLDRSITQTGRWSLGSSNGTRSVIYGTVRPTNTSVNFIIKAVIGPIEDSAADQVLQQCINYNSPDWANAQSITLSTSDYVVPDDGWIVGVAYANDSSITINGITVAISQFSANNYVSWSNLQVKVSKGDIVKATGSFYSQNTHFVPHK